MEYNIMKCNGMELNGGGMELNGGGMEEFLLNVQDEIVRLEQENDELRKILKVKNDIIKQLECSLLDDGKVYKTPFSCQIEKKYEVGCIGSKDRFLESIKKFLISKKT